MPDFDSAGVRLHYEMHGDPGAPPIVLVHGFCSDYHLNWVGTRWQETLVHAGFHVLGLDCRGHGHSEKPHDPAAYDRSVMAADVGRLLEHLELDAADYLGYSMGGRIGLQLLVDTPERVRRAVFGGVGAWAGRERPEHAERTARRLRGDASIDDPMANMFYDFARARAINDLEALACCILGPQPHISDEQLAAVRTPVLICTGDEDAMARGGDGLAERLGNGRHFNIAGRNHMNAVPARAFKDAAVEFFKG